MTPAQSTSINVTQQAAGGSDTHGLDLVYTKVAVDFQNFSAEAVEDQLREGLQALTDATGTDAFFVALLDREGESFQNVYAGRTTFSTCNPEVLKDCSLSDFPWLR